MAFEHSLEREEVLMKLIRTMTEALVDRPEEVHVNGVFGPEANAYLTVVVAYDDVGKVIGIKGRTARSLRTILAAASRKLGVHVDLNIAGSGEQPTN